MKKLSAILLAVVLMLSLGVTVFAQDGSTITVTNAKVGETYSLYKILDLSLDAEKGAFTYTLPEGSLWEAFFTNADTGATWFAFNKDSRVVTAKAELNETTKYTCVSAMLAYRDAHEEIAAKQQKVVGDDKTVVFENLELGWYLIDSTVGAMVIVETNSSDISVADKSAAPSLTKKVQEDSTTEWGTKNTAEIGQVVNYMVTISNVRKLHHVDLRDQMSDGLTFDPTSVKVYIGSVNDANLVTGETDPGVIGTGSTWYLVDATHHSPDFGAEHLGQDTFHIHFRDNWIDQFPANTNIIVTYSATLNKNAVIAGEGNPNTAYLAYGNSQESNHDTVKTFTWEVPVFKYARTTTDAKKPLAGAKFVLRKVPKTMVTADAATDDVLYAVIENCIVTEWVQLQENATVLTTDENGLIEVTGLDSDYYQLIETEAPVGYNKLTAPVSFGIDENGVMRNSSSTEIAQVEIENRTGTELPSTGGIGTTIFYIVGAVLVLGAVVLLVSRKRADAMN